MADPVPAPAAVYRETRERLGGFVVGLGARKTDIGQGEVAWTVLVDPEGNEFCVLTSREGGM